MHSVTIESHIELSLVMIMSDISTTANVSKSDVSEYNYQFELNLFG